MKMANFKQALIDAMNQAGIDDREERAGIAAIAGGESGFQPRTVPRSDTRTRETNASARSSPRPGR